MKNRLFFLFLVLVFFSYGEDLEKINEKLRNKNIEEIDQGRLADEIYRVKGKDLEEKVKESMEKARAESDRIQPKMKKELTERKEKAEKEIGEKVRKVYRDFQENEVQRERVKKFSKDLYEEVGPYKSVKFRTEDFSSFGSATLGVEIDKSKGSKSDDLLPPDERLYIFMSASVPESIWETYGEDLKNLGSRRIIVVLRGCIGPDGCKYIKPTINFLRRVLFNNGNETRGIEIQIDPYLFKKYNVKVVPTFVYVKGLRVKNPSLSEGLAENIDSDPKILVLKGDVSIRGVVEKFLEHSDFPGLRKMAEFFRGLFS